MDNCINLKGDLLKKIQETELEILKVVADFCEANDIKYCLTSGTLLGAVRHKGFIPWDDDVDISMPRSDFEKFLKISRNLPNEYECVATRLNQNYPIAIVKVRKKGTIMKEPSMAHLDINHGVWIDIFPLDKVKYSKRLKTRAYLFNLITTIINYKLEISVPNKTYTKILCAILGVLSVKTLDKVRTKIMTLEENSQAKKYTSFASNLGPGKLLLNEEIYFPLKRLKFEDSYFFAPAQSEIWLKSAYGNYMTLPPENERVNRHKIVEIKL